jgi:hypothetical protein
MADQYFVKDQEYTWRCKTEMSVIISRLVDTPHTDEVLEDHLKSVITFSKENKGIDKKTGR